MKYAHGYVVIIVVILTYSCNSVYFLQGRVTGNGVIVQRTPQIMKLAGILPQQR